MFEKEAEEFADCKKSFWRQGRTCIDSVRQAFQKGAEFGYNKANEWHYMKDVNCYEDLHFPPIEDCKGRIWIWKVKDCSENYHCGTYDDLWYEIQKYHVIAWKEIVLPKEIE